MAIYTYKDFATESVKLGLGETIENFDKDRFILKAQALFDRETKASETAKANPKKKAPKGKSAETLAKLAAIRAKLTTEFQTAAELGYNALEVSNAVRGETDIISVKAENGVIRSVIGKDGLTSEKRFAAYKLA